MDAESKVKLFVLSNSIAEHRLDRVESELGLDLGRYEKAVTKEEDYYAQFDAAFRNEAKVMARHYEIFYCLEKSIRSLIVQIMKESYSDNWWDLKVREDIKRNVEANIRREAESGFTERSELEIDYTTFGELTSIVQDNWEAFSALFKNPKAFSKIMTSLNQLRGPIAHCCPLAEDEVVRLNLAVKDWFRLMA
uniref:Swt1-like HEPN domain-containing protein n=1 Tax=Dechloromonas aromatica (strain RCB) TaxID=159087 RepID=Q479W0_DECAR